MLIAGIHKTNYLVILVIFLNLVFAFDISMAADIKKSEEEMKWANTPFIFSHLGLDLNKYFTNNSMAPEANLIRTANEQFPGYYYQNPNTCYGHETTVDSLDIKYIKNVIIQYMGADYYDDEILNYIKNYNLSVRNRKEFFFTVISNDIEFKFSGWYGKFVHIIIDADFDSAKDFVNNAEKYFNIPKLDEDKVTCYYNEEVLSDGKSELFYTYNDELGSNLKLIGYSVLGTEAYVDKIKKTVIDLTIYTEGQTDETTK